MSCIFTPPKDVIDPVIKENKIVIITESVEDEKVEVLKSLLSKHDVQEEDILVHEIPDNCHKGRMKAHLEEMTGGEELPFVTCNGVNLGASSQVLAMADTGDLYKALHGKDREVANGGADGKKNVKPERKVSVMDRFFGDPKKPEKKKRNTLTGSVVESEGTINKQEKDQ